MSLGIVYPDESGNVYVLRPVPEFLERLPAEWSEEEKLIHIANKDLATGQKFEVVDLSTLPDRRFFGAWEYSAGESEKESSELGAVFKAKYGQELSDSEKLEVQALLAAKAEEKLEQIKVAEAAEAERLANLEEVPANPKEES